MSHTDAPPQNLEAEEDVLGAMMLAADAVDAVRDELDPKDFYRPTHGRIFQVLLALRDEEAPTDAVFVAAELERRGQLDDAGGASRVQELAARVPPVANARHYARLVREAAERREERTLGNEIAEAAWNGGLECYPELGDRLRRLLDRGRQAAQAERIADGRTFAFARPSTEQLWGGAWVTGEGTMLCAPQGVGKTTLAQRLVLARIGIGTHVLGMAVARSEEPVLYVAADRPNQAARSLARMVEEETHGERLAELLRVWRGPLPFDLLADPTRLAGFARTHGAGTLILDTLSAVAPDLSRDETGSRLNLAFQSVVASGIELLVCHHQRKGQVGNPKPKTLDDVYGSVFNTSGLGSVVLLWGKAGDPIIEFVHLKQPAEEVGPFQVTIDYETGNLAIHEAASVAELLATTPAGLTAKAAAANLTGSSEPTAADVEKARRKLEALVREGLARRVDPDETDDPVRYFERLERDARWSGTINGCAESSVTPREGQREGSHAQLTTPHETA